MKTLVTGGGGFVGRAVIDRLLQRGWTCRTFGRADQPELAELGVEVHRGDLTDQEAVNRAVAGVEVVFHVAARAGVWGDWETFAGPNLRGTEHVVAACRRNGVRHLVYTSTPSVVFNRQPFRGENESLPYGRDWLCHYAHTKALAERHVLEAHGNDLQTLALRPHLIWGPGDPHLLPRVIDSVRAGRLKIVGDGKNRVDVIYVDNVADAHVAALDALLRGEGGGRAYFLNQGGPVELWPWLNEILRRLGHAPLRRRVPLAAAYAAGAVAEAVWRVGRRAGEPPMTRFVAVELAKDHYFDGTAARRVLGYVPTVDMETGLQRLVEDLRARGYGAEA